MKSTIETAPATSRRDESAQKPVTGALRTLGVIARQPITNDSRISMSTSLQVPLSHLKAPDLERKILMTETNLCPLDGISRILMQIATARGPL
jgi:hypothetical protein